MSNVFIQFTYPINEPDKFTYETNLKENAIEEVLSNYIQGCIGDGKTDKREPNNKDVYTLRIELDLSSDTFTSSSDCGNTSLAFGIIIDIFKRLNARLTNDTQPNT